MIEFFKKMFYNDGIFLRHSFFKIIKSELKSIFSDPGTILIMLLGVFMYSLFYAIPYSAEVLRDVPIGVIDFDNTQLSRNFVRMLNSSESVKVAMRPVSIQQAKDKFFEGKIKAYVVIPSNFARDVNRANPVNIPFYGDSSYLLVYRQVATGVSTVATSLGSKIELEKMMKQGASSQQAMATASSCDFITQPLFNPASGYSTYIYPVVLILILQQTLLVGIGLLGGTLRERNEAFCAYSNNLPLAIIAKATAHVLLYLVHSISYFLIFPIVFNYPMHYNVIVLLALLIPYLYSISFLAQALVYFFDKRETSLLVLVVTALPMVFLPGFIWPKEAIPAWLNFFANFVPATNAIAAIVRVNQMAASFWQVRYEFYVLVGLSAMYFVCAYHSIKKVCKK